MISQKRIQKIKALAERGVGGERQNAQSILDKIMAQPQHKTINLTSFTVGKGGKLEKGIDYSFQCPTQSHDILIPYYEFVVPNTKNDVMRSKWRKIGSMVKSLIDTHTGGYCVQNWADKMTVNCTHYDVQQIQDMVNAFVYDHVCSLNIPVIHVPKIPFFYGDMTRPVMDRSMEDGTANSIFEYQSAEIRKVPNVSNEIAAAAAGNHHINYVIETADTSFWGFISAYDSQSGMVTIQPRNTEYKAHTLHVSDIATLWQAKAGAGWAVGVDFTESRARKAAINNPIVQAA